MKNRIILISIIMLSSFGWYGCKPSTAADEDKDLFTIVATTGMIADAASIIAGDSARVWGLMGPGVDPHLYKPTQGDIRRLSEADLVLYNGLLLEGKMQEVLQKMERNKPVVAVASAIEKSRLLVPEGHAGAPDPHIWFDVQLWRQAVLTVSRAMQQHNPGHASLYQQHTDAYLQELDSLDQWVRQTLATIPEEQRVLVTAHDAFGYFGKAYGIEVKGLQGISTLAEYGLRDIQELVTFIAARKIPAVFVESSVSEKALEAVVTGARERGHTVRIGGSLFSDAMGQPGTPEGSYLGMVRHNVITITEALKGNDRTSN
ncbi:manganese ABC transporter manganese binding lipoprotein [Flammeovirgaceae bacterium 311]|nr:manganese ABC transporter manganese binding lipoprotein [Flammeovirgaceae bacterium 311]